MDIFERKGLEPMLIKEMQQPFNDPDYIYELKLDGIRCIAYIDENGIEFRNKRNKILTPLVLELSDTFRQAKSRCILDGELIVLRDGVPNFHEIQKRTLMNSPFKLKILSMQLPATFIAYDILYLEDHELITLPLMERKALLKETMKESERLAISRYIDEKGIELFDLAKQQQLEGVIAKKKDSLYHYGKRTTDWIKFKFLKDEDFVVCGYIKKQNNMASLIMAQYRGNTLIYKGHVTLGVSLNTLFKHNIKKTDTSPIPIYPEGNEDALWLEPTVVCTIEYMPDKNIKHRRSVLKGLRTDKLPIECQEPDAPS